MKKKVVPGIRAKFYLAILMGLVLAGILLVVVQSVILPRFGIGNGQSAQWEETYAWAYFASFVLLAVIFSSLITRRTIRRIEAIGAAAEAIGRGELTYRVGDRSGDELGRLSRHIDRMASDLDEALGRERSAEEEKTAMIASLSHDMRTPLTSLSGYLEMAELRLAPLRHGFGPSEQAGAGECEAVDRNREAKELEEALRCIASARRKVGELERHAGELLDYTLLGQHMPQADFTIFSLDTLLGQVVSDFLPELERTGMRLEHQNQSEKERMEVCGDPMLLARMFGNLIENAVRYGASGGILRVQTGRCQDWIKIEVINEGEPIAEQDLPHLFERMYRGEKSRSGETGGRGLGLAVVREIAHRHGGSVEVRSGPGETCFTVFLPSSNVRKS